jgi:CheY-like chemotaxis protein
MRILVVDDDPAVAEMIAEAVRSVGHEALVALDGMERLPRPRHAGAGRAGGSGADQESLSSRSRRHPFGSRW